MKAIAMAAMVGLFLVSTVSVQARWGDLKLYCKSGAKVQDVKSCKENGGSQ
jgi:hypothetical protein